MSQTCQQCTFQILRGIKFKIRPIVKILCRILNQLQTFVGTLGELLRSILYAEHIFTRLPGVEPHDMICRAPIESNCCTCTMKLKSTPIIDIPNLLPSSTENI